MKTSILLAAAASCLLASCTILSPVIEMDRSKPLPLESLQLTPDWEPNELRIDLIRQTYTENTSDSTCETRNTPYHPLGFNLGNGLFYDLNKNLTFRIDHLLGFNPEVSFELIHTYPSRRQNRGQAISFHNNTLTNTFSPRNKSHLRYERLQSEDSVSYFFKNRHLYSIVETDSSLAHWGSRRINDIIQKEGEGHYRSGLSRRQWEFFLEDGQVRLDQHYVISMANDYQHILVLGYRKKGNRKLYTIELTNSEIRVYNHRLEGLKVEKKSNAIDVYWGKTLTSRYELKTAR